MPAGTHNTLIPGCGLHHISIQTVDYAESVRFYRDVLGMPLRLAFNAGGRPFALLDMGDGSYIELQAPQVGGEAPFPPDSPAGARSASPAGALAHFALATSDVRAVIEKVRAAGCVVTTEPKEVMLHTLPATVAFFNGPSGESVELFQER